MYVIHCICYKQKVALNSVNHYVLSSITCSVSKNMYLFLQGPNALTQRLLKNINESGKLHMVPALVNENFVIRFAVCAENADVKDITYAWKVITEAASDLMSSKSELEKTKDYERMENCELSETESEDEVFDNELFDTELIFDQQRINLKRACERRNLFHRMVSDPKGINRTLLRALSFDGQRKIRSESDVNDEDGDVPRKTADGSEMIAKLALDSA